MKNTQLVVGALILCSNLFAQPKGIDAYEKKFFTNQLMPRTWVKKRTDQVYYFSVEPESFGRLALLKELKKVLNEYGKRFEEPDDDFSVGFEDVDKEDITKIISYLYQGGKQLDYFFLIGEYTLGVSMGDVVNCISIYKLNKKELLYFQNKLK
jgi:hypothetical protein